MTTTTSTTIILSSFRSKKEHCLGKRDKSNAGRIDPRVVDLCAAVNDRDEYYTTSSCAGRCFLYRGDGIKSHHHFAATTSSSSSAAAAAAAGTTVNDVDNDDDENDNSQRRQDSNDGDDTPRTTGGFGYFERFRVNHDVIRDAKRYFNLETLMDGSDPTGGGDPVRLVGQFEFKNRLADNNNNNNNNNKNIDDESKTNHDDNNNGANTTSDDNNNTTTSHPLQQKEDKTIWLRFEPFILHVSCLSLSAAAALMRAARPAFKNVGLTTWKISSSSQQQTGKFLVVIWGDEGLDMPLSAPDDGSFLFVGREEWLMALVNERHKRNWGKIDRFARAVRDMPPFEHDDDDDEGGWEGEESQETTTTSLKVPKRFDVIGDVALLHSLPEGRSESDLAKIGEAILAKNKAIKICVARTTPLSTYTRSPTPSGLRHLAGPHRTPLLTTHVEHSIKCVISLSSTFFSPRMSHERRRLCHSVARGERILVLFAGCGMETLQLAGRTECGDIVCVEKNPVAVECLLRGVGLLRRNKAVKGMTCFEDPAGRVRVVEGDAVEVCGELLEESSSGEGEGKLFDRVLAPRPKMGGEDGEGGTGDHGVGFLEALVPLLKSVGGECHWYDFVADWEFPECQRTVGVIEGVCRGRGLGMEVIHVAHVGSVAMRQIRVCVDFRLTGPLG